MTSKYESNQSSMQAEVDAHQKKIEASLERARDDGFDELMEIMRVVLPEDVLKGWEETYKDPRFIKVDVDRVCTRCGAIVYAGAKEQHKRWHRYMTFSMWSMQAGILDALGRRDLVDGE